MARRQFLRRAFWHAPFLCLELTNAFSSEAWHRLGLRLQRHERRSHDQAKQHLRAPERRGVALIAALAPLHLAQKSA